jgi:hypothetical protein
VPENDVRLYDAEGILSIASRLQQERSTLAKTIAAVIADREARERYLGNARAGGSALWLFAPTKDRADQLVGRRVEDHNRILMDFGIIDVEHPLDPSLGCLPMRRPNRLANAMIARFVPPEVALAAAQQVVTPTTITKRGTLVHARK